MGKEDLRVIKTRAAIKKALLELMSQKPFGDITVKEIASRAQCNRNTFYLHYIDKYDLIEKLCASSLDGLKKSLFATYEKQYPSNMDWYSDIAIICLDTIEADISFYSVASEKNKQSQFAEQYRVLLVDFINTGIKRMGKQPKMLEVEFSANGMVGVLRYWLANHCQRQSKNADLWQLNFVG